MTIMEKSTEVTRHEYIEQYLKNYAEYQRLEVSIESQKSDVDIQTENMKQKAEELAKLQQQKNYCIRDIETLKARETQTGLNEKEAAEKYNADGEKNLIDKEQYKKECDSLDYKQKIDTVLAKDTLQKELDEQKELLSNKLAKLRQEEKAPENISVCNSEINVLDKVEKMKLVRCKRDSFTEFLEKEKKHDKRVATISDTLENTDKAEIYSKMQNIRTIGELRKRCEKLAFIKPYEEQEYKTSSINKYVIPILCGIAAIVGMIFLMYTMDLSGSTQLAGAGIASIVWKVIIAVILAGMGGAMMADDMVGEWMYKVIPAVMLVILIINEWGMHIGVMAWINNIFWLLVLLGILKLMSKTDSEEVAMVFFVIFFVLAMIWEFKGIALRTPGFMVNIFAFLTNAALRYLIPVLCGGIVFVMIRLLFTKTPMGKIAVAGRRKKNIKSGIAAYEKDKDGYLTLYYANYIMIMLARADDIQQLQNKLIELDGLYEEKIEQAEDEMAVKYGKLRKQLEKERDKQIREKESYIWNLKSEKGNIRQKRIESEKKRERLESEINGLCSEIDQLNRQKSEKLAKLSQQMNAFKKLEISLCKMSNELRTDSEDTLASTAGVMDNNLYFDISIQKDRSGFIKLQSIRHNCEKLVFLYDEEKEILHGNLAEGLERYIDWTAAAFTRANYWEIFDQIKMRIIDVVSGGKPFIGGEKGDSYIVYGNADAIQRYEREVKNQIDDITDMCDGYGLSKVDISELNKRMADSAEKNGEVFGEDEPNAKYNVCFVMIPNDEMQNPDIIPQSLWSYFNGCERYGIMPVFFVGNRTWENLDKTHQIKTQVKAEHVFVISRTDDAMNIQPYRI